MTVVRFTHLSCGDKAMQEATLRKLERAVAKRIREQAEIADKLKQEREDEEA